MDKIRRQISGLGLKYKSAIWLGTIISVSLFLMGAAIYWQGLKLAEKKLIDNTRNKIENDVSSIETFFKAARTDLLIFEGTFPVQAIIRAKDNGGIDPVSKGTVEEWSGRLAMIFKSFLVNHAEYSHICYIDEKGNEFVRVDFDGNTIKSVSKEDLQNISDAACFAETIRIKHGEIHYSEVCLQRNYGQVQTPHVPILLESTPVYDGKNKPKGIIVIGLRVNEILKKLGGKPGEGGIRKYCVNERGDVFLHPDKSKEFGFDLGFDYSLKDIAPEMVEEVKSMDYSTKHDKEHQHVDSFKKLFFDPLNKGRYWAVIYEIPYGYALKDIHKTRNVMVIVGIVIVVCSVIIITVFVSKKIVRPIIMIANAAKKMDEGDLSVRLPTGKTGGEFGMIYHTMNAFAESQQNSIERFEKELAARTCELEKRASYERSFGETISFFNTTYNLKSALNQTLTPLAARHPFPVSAIYMYDEWSGIFQCMASHGATKALKTEFALGEGIVGQAAMERKVCILDEISQELSLTIETGIASLKPACIVISPITYQEKISGVLVLASMERLTEVDTVFISRLSDQLGVAVNSLKQYSNLKELSVQLRLKSEEISAKNSQLEQANKLKSEFLANMSHELRTPLNAIIGFSEMLKDGLLGDLAEKQKTYITDIFNSGQHLLSLINDILDLSKIEAGRTTLDLDPVCIPDMLKNGISIIKEHAMAHHTKITLDIDKDIGIVLVDTRKFKQLIYNLLSNAVKFTPDGGDVSIKARKIKRGVDGDLLEISVADTGIGISQENIQKLFRPFEQLDGSVSRKYGGTGLGLAMVKRLVELHGGTVEVASEPGKGTCFTIKLPYRTEDEKTPLTEVTPIVDERSVTSVIELSKVKSPLVLIVEDDNADASLIRIQLENEGYRTVTAATGQQGLEMVNSHMPDLITLDIILPDMSGLEFLSMTRQDKNLANIPVVIVSIIADEKKGFALGAAAVLQKPVKRDTLLNTIRNLEILSETPAKQRRILVVDDEPKAIDIVSAYLEKEGFYVLRAYGGQEGIDIANKENPDLIVLDLMMPVINGFDVVDALKAKPETRGIPIIILTAKVVTAEDIHILSGNVLKIAQKNNFTGESFISEVRRSLGKKALQGKVQKTETIGIDTGSDIQKDLSPDIAESPVILIVENNPKDADIIRLYLKEGGYRLLQATNGKAALDIMTQSAPDLILLDLKMPVMDGFTFLDQKSRHPEFANIPIIIVSGIADGSKCVTLKASAFLEKPVKRDVLMNVISSIGIKPVESKKKILLIDDDPMAITIISSYFNSTSYEIGKAYGGKEGIEIANKIKPDLIILDLMMPEMNGFEVLNVLRNGETTRDIPVIILTARILSKKEYESLAEKVVNIVEKGGLSKDEFLSNIKSSFKKTPIIRSR